MSAPLSDAELRIFGRALRLFAHDTAAELRRMLSVRGLDIDSVLVAAMQSEDAAAKLYRRYHAVPLVLLAATAAILLTLPRPRQGRPRKPSTDSAQKLKEAGQTGHGAANLIAALTGENAEDIRNRLRGLKRYKPKGRQKPR